MVVIILEHASDKLRGYITRYLQMVKPGTYVGNIPANSRDAVWDMCESEHSESSEFAALLIYNSNTESGYQIEMIGEPKRFVQDFNGIQLVSIATENDPVKTMAQLLWAKLNPYKSLYDHMYETGMTARILLENSIYAALVPLFMELLGLEKSKCIDTIAFLIACHDIGKAHPSFQIKASNVEEYKVVNCLEALQTHHMISQFIIEGFRHERYSQEIMCDWLKKFGMSHRIARNLSGIYGMHHISKNANEDIKISSHDNEQTWMQIQEYLINTLKQEFYFDCINITSEKIDVFCTLLLSFLYRCDWIASSLFSKSVYVESWTGYKRYVDCTLKDYVKSIGISKIDTDPLTQMYQMNMLFPELKKYNLYPLQEKVQEIIQKNPIYDCIILEDQPGHGKTEAGTYIATQVMRNRQGIYFGLPTNATEQAMNPRIQKMLDTVYGQGTIDAKHASGKSWITEELTVEEETKDLYSYASQKAMKLIFPFSTGTVDQIESGGLRKKYGTITLMDLACKVIVIDEMHAYDAYMQKILCTVLAWLKELHVPVVIMSATLPNLVKRKIAAIYCSDPEISIQNAYPLITVFRNNQTEQYPVDNQSTEKQYNIKIAPILEDNSQIASTAIDTIKDGGCLAVIVNTVDKAKNIYKELLTMQKTDVELFLIHARFPDEQRDLATKKIITKFGKDRSNRPEKAIVVSTQILEQSIDVDFDFMMSELAPIDLLLQRVGREWRHSNTGTVRERLSISCPTLTVLVNEDIEKDKKAKIYAPILQILTRKLLETKNYISIPGDIRGMIETVYTEDSCSEMDSWIGELQSKYEDKLREHNFAAITNSISPPSDEGRFQLFKVKSKLFSNMPTRISDIATTKVAILPSNLYTLVKQADGKVDKKIAAEILYRYTTPIGDYKLTSVQSEYIIGKTWLDGVRCYQEELPDIYMDQILGLETIQ